MEQVEFHEESYRLGKIDALLTLEKYFRSLEGPKVLNKRIPVIFTQKEMVQHLRTIRLNLEEKRS